jgi:hypothetical protein
VGCSNPLTSRVPGLCHRPWLVGVVKNAMPCSGMNNGQAEGSAIELWQSIAQNNGWQYTYQPINTSNAAVEAGGRGEIDLPVSYLNIISERLEKSDFSVPYQEDSLAFLSPKKATASSRCCNASAENRSCETRS